MKKVLLGLILLVSTACFSQTYVSGNVSFYNGTGDFGNKGQASVEVGRTWDVLSVGICGGTTSFSNGDAYAEVRTGVTVFQKGRISVTPNLGVGYVFSSNTDYLVEYGIAGTLSINKNCSVSLFAGTYHFNGTNAYSKATFTGISFTHCFK